MKWICRRSTKLKMEKGEFLSALWSIGKKFEFDICGFICNFFYSNLQLEMSVIEYPENYHSEDMRGKAFAVMTVRDVEGVIRRVLDLIPRQSFDMYVEVKYLESVLNFCRK